MEIAEEYAALADEDLQERIFSRIREEYQDAVDLVQEITGRDSLVKRAWLEENMERRNPYVDPLNLLQTRLLAQSHLTETEEADAPAHGPRHRCRDEEHRIEVSSRRLFLCDGISDSDVRQRRLSRPSDLGLPLHDRR